MTLWRGGTPASAGRLDAAEQSAPRTELGAGPIIGTVGALNESANALAAETEMLEANTRALLANAEAQRQAEECQGRLKSGPVSPVEKWATQRAAPVEN
jgi:hypothetical protein